MDFVDLGYVLEPIVDLVDEEPIGHELLARPRSGVPFHEWGRPRLPRLAASIARSALRCAAREIGSGQMLHVNVTTVDLERDTFVAEVRSVIDGAVRPQLVIELTEVFGFTDEPAVERSVAALRTDGVRFAVDDFGEGFANLSFLRVIRPEIVKVDRRTLTGRDGDDGLATWLLDTCEALGVTTTVVEQIETAAQAQWARDVGFDAGQGYRWPSTPATAR